MTSRERGLRRNVPLQSQRPGRRRGWSAWTWKNGAARWTFLGRGRCVLEENRGIGLVRHAIAAVCESANALCAEQSCVGTRTGRGIARTAPFSARARRQCPRQPPLRCLGSLGADLMGCRTGLQSVFAKKRCCTPAKWLLCLKIDEWRIHVYGGHDGRKATGSCCEIACKREKGQGRVRRRPG
jgi:hypothetical protein